MSTISENSTQPQRVGIATAALRSTKTYLEWLEKEGKGKERYLVKRVPIPGRQVTYMGEERWTYSFETQPHLRLRADSKIEYFPCEMPDAAIDAFIKSYDKRSGLVSLVFDKQMESESGHIVVDFTWLVRRLMKWLIRYGGQIQPKIELQLPTSAPAPKDFERWLLHNKDLLLTPSESQTEAMLNALTHPFSYTWGPPGSGKTKCVLATMANFLMQTGLRILIFSPTNNSLDNALEAVISLSEKLGYDRNKILRIGFPSPEFREKYPECCETGNLQSEMNEMRNALASFRNMLEELRTLKGKEDALNELSKSKQKVEEEHCRALEDVTVAKRRLDDLEGEEQKWKKRMEGEEEAKQAKESALVSLSWWSTIFSSKARSLRAEIRQHDTVENTIRHEIEVIDKRKNAAYTELAQAQQGEKKSADSAQSIDARIIDVQEIIISTRNRLGVLDATQIGTREAELVDEIARIENYLRDVKQRIQSRSVIGMTLDAYISFTDKGGFRSDWVFVDEAAYAPIVKVLPLHASPTPKSLFGDHQQLPPVCEADDNDAAVQSYWGKSCLFMEDAYVAPGNHEALWEAHEPSFQALSRSVLKETYRFGDKMARALDKHVYCGVGLRSAGASAPKTRILVVEVHARGGQEKRVNLAESDAVVEIVRKLLTSNGAQDIAVVTPYKNQIKTIRKALRACNSLSEIDALNTHQTQGREWDTVIFSAVDGTLPRCRPYFTNSKIPVGRAVLNTTLSRVKSQLILVVEKEFWRQKEGQLLCDLVKLAEPFKGDWAVDL